MVPVSGSLQHDGRQFSLECFALSAVSVGRLTGNGRHQRLRCRSDSGKFFVLVPIPFSLIFPPSIAFPYHYYNESILVYLAHYVPYRFTPLHGPFSPFPSQVPYTTLRRSSPFIFTFSPYFLLSHQSSSLPLPSPFPLHHRPFHCSLSPSTRPSLSLFLEGPFNSYMRYSCVSLCSGSG